MYTTAYKFLHAISWILYFSLLAILLCLTSTASSADKQIHISVVDSELQSCPRNTEAETQVIKASADRMITGADGYARLSGNVQIKQGTNRIRAGQIHYNLKKKLVQAKNNVLYTNCGAVSPAWFIAADQISLSQNQAVAKSAWLVFGNTPIFYFPRYRILLDEKRKSGLLTPDISSSNSRGLEIGTPYYFNISPNHDAVLTPRYLGKRGLQFDNEYRYLTHWGAGELEADWLDDHKYNDNRYSYQIKHNYTNNDDTRFNMHYQRVSDKNYTDDISKSFHFSSENYLRSYINLDHVWNGWRLNMIADTLQSADEDIDTMTNPRPYEIRPAITVAKNFYPAGTGLAVNMHSQWTRFDYRGTGPGNRIDGQRFDNQLGVSWPYKRPDFHLTPAANIRYTSYDLSRPYDIDPRKISRTVPSFSVRSGLIFEKNGPDQRYRHTLEPELFYLNVAKRNQDDIPLFDTGRTEFRFSELFSDNRFNSIDRIGDADQLTLALTKRVIHERTGKEVLRASLGQIYYFRKNTVTLEDEENSDRNNSDIAAELLMDLNSKVKWRSALVWNQHDSETSRLVNRVSLDAGKNRLINLYHRYRRDNDDDEQQYEQLGFNFRIPVADRWHLLSAWSYDTKNSDSLEVLGGIEYQSCCWGLRLLGQRTLKDIDGIRSVSSNLDYDTTIGLELNFRGLGSVANYSEDLLEKSIFNYQAP